MLTSYGYPGDTSYDSNSGAGIGNHNNQLTALQSAALSPDVAQQYGIRLGQSFSVTAANGQTFNLIYADSTDASLTGRIDVYDPQAILGGNNFSAGVQSVNNGPVLFGNGIAGTGTAVNFNHTAIPPYIDAILSKFESAAKSWGDVIQGAAAKLFWMLALISLVWTGTVMILRQADLMEIMAEVFRYIMFTGFFYWLLENGPDFAGKIVASLWQIGGQATGLGNSVYPADLVNLGMQLLLASSVHINWLTLSPAAGIPFCFGLIILVLCALITVNVIVLLSASWVVLFAGLIFLGFGGCRWTSELAVSYFRTMLGVGVSLLVMQLIVGVGAQFLAGLVQSMGANPDIPGMASIMVATIIVLVLSHRLPHMVAGIALGGGAHQGIGTLGYMTMLGAMMGAGNVARAATGGGTMEVDEGARMLQERISRVMEAASGGAGQPLTAREPVPQPVSVPARPANQNRFGVADDFKEPFDKPMSPDQQREQEGKI
jgi:P-type conjugative transfer protein TrbL